MMTINSIAQNIQTVFYYMRKNNFSKSTEPEFIVNLRRVQIFFDFSEKEAIIFSALFYNYMSYCQRPICYGSLSECSETSPLRFLSFSKEIESLEKRGFIYTDSSGDESSRETFYRISEGIVEAVKKDEQSLVKNGLHKKERELTYPDDIPAKELFYSEKINSDISEIYTYLSKENFDKIQKRMIEKAMPKGVCVMFHGHSGTGKTESVFQIAKETGRAIYRVDIGGMISQWMGGTASNISNVFEKYKKFCENSKKHNEPLPILLFNEADAIFGKRISATSDTRVGGWAVDENHTQAALLDHIERQEGILIITTNMPGNFDEAFERRFLFKIKFEKPDFEIKKKIWKSKVAWLKKDAVSQLASNFDLTGAEIENIVRKATMKEVLTGKRPNLKELENYCRKEKLEQNRHGKIGF